MYYLCSYIFQSMSEKIITGIQQVGIGVRNLREAWRWYRHHFGMDIRVFEEEAYAEYMLPYTGGEPRKRHAALAVNMQGGGGFEIWQYKCREPEPAGFQLLLGDVGIFAAKIKSRDIARTHQDFVSNGVEVLGDITSNPSGIRHFFVRDPFNNIFEVVESGSWFSKDQRLTGGTYGAIIGVTQIDRALVLYQRILGYDKVEYDLTGSFDDLASLPGQGSRIRRVLLSHSKRRMGGFSRFFGESQIELIQVLDRKPEYIFKNRLWGDLGFIHLCFDISGMMALKKECASHGFKFTVDSMQHLDDSFDMGEAAGHFSYIEDPDGTLIEFVETHKLPLLKKLGVYINMRKRDPRKHLPDWILKGLRFSRIRD